MNRGCGYVISVLISTYNDRCYVEKKLAEIKAQSFFDRAEFIFIETGSPERERELLEPFCRENQNCKLIVLDERKGLYEAWNLGWEAASAPLICYSNMDDCMHPRLLEYVVNGMERHCWDACCVLVAKQRIDQPCDWSAKRLRGLKLNLRSGGPFMAWRNELKNSVGGFDGRFIAAGDKDFCSRMVEQKVRLGLIKKVLYLYNKGPNQLSKVNDGERRKHDERLQAEKPYVSQWSYKIRWQIFWRRYLFRTFPHLYVVE
jgi:cellulose synthase/poly-beta-1,6-N-acetylglucosamine synthase-like glycosyltransferase